jgi:hypothetical protein
LSLEQAFEKYRYLNNIQVEAMTELGLNRQQVTSSNFGSHTINAIKDIQKRTKELSSHEAFELVREKSNTDTKTFVESYLLAKKKSTKTYW